MWSERRRPAIDRAAALRTDWRRFSRLVGKHRANTFIRQRSSKTGYMLLHYLVKLNRKMLQLGRVQQLTGHITPILKFLHWLKVNERIEYKPLSLTLTKFLQLLNLAIFTTLSLFNFLAFPAHHLLSLFLARQPSPWKSQIAYLDMHHLVFGSTSRFIPSASPFSS